MLKYPLFSEGRVQGNSIQLLNTSELHTNLQRISGMGACAIQKFVKCKGPNPFIIRSVWKRMKPTNVWVISSKTSFFDTN